MSNCWHTHFLYEHSEKIFIGNLAYNDCRYFTLSMCKPEFYDYAQKDNYQDNSGHISLSNMAFITDLRMTIWL